MPRLPIVPVPLRTSDCSYRPIGARVIVRLVHRARSVDAQVPDGGDVVQGKLIFGSVVAIPQPGIGLKLREVVAFGAYTAHHLDDDLFVVPIGCILAAQVETTDLQDELT